MTMPDPSAGGGYVLGTGSHGSERLHVVAHICEPATRWLLDRAGIEPGMRVVDVGCGIGTVTALLAERVGPSGSVVGVDVNQDQLEIARGLAAERGLANVEFAAGDAAATRLERGTFDVAYSRFVLMHLRDPAGALREMTGLLADEGLLVCEEADSSRWWAWPPAPGLRRMWKLFEALSTARGQDWQIGPKLPGLLRAAGVPNPGVSVVQPAFLDGPGKRLPLLNLREGGEHFAEAGLVEREELEELRRELEALSLDGDALVTAGMVVQAWGRPG